MEHDPAVDGEKVGNRGWLADAEVDIGAARDVGGNQLGDLAAGQGPSVDVLGGYPATPSGVRGVGAVQDTMRLM